MRRPASIRFLVTRLLAGLLLAQAAATPAFADIFDVVYGPSFAAPYSIYSLNQTTGAPTTLYPNYPPGGAGSAAMAQRGSDGMIFYVAGTAGNDPVYRWNPATPLVAPVLLGTTGASVPYMPRLAFAQNDVLYGINTAGANLYTLNQTTGAATSVATFTGPPAGGGDFTFAPDGTLYLVSGATLYSMPLAGGAAVNLGAITGGTGSFVGMAYNPNGTNVIINDANPASIYTLNTTTRVATLIGAAGAAGAVFGDLASAPGQYITGKVFEDANYGGGAGRTLAASGGVGRPNARVELYSPTGNFITFATTDASGNYQLVGAAGHSYFVRVVSSSVTSSRTGFVAGVLPVQTFRTNASSGAAVAVTDRVGGEIPNLLDAGNGSTTLAALTTATTTAQSVTTIATSTIIGGTIANVDFGFNFDIVANVNATGQGSLQQFITNANALSNTGLAQSGKPAGIENTIFMISNGTAAPGLRAVNNYFVGGVATIAPASALTTISDPIVIDGTVQPGFSTTPVIELNGASAGAGANGLTISAGGSTVNSLAINRFNSSGISLSSTGSNTIIGNFIGTNASGTSASGNAQNGVDVVSGNTNTIGGTSAAAANVLSGNTGSGLNLRTGVSGTIVQGNFIGTNSTAISSIANGTGITLTTANNNTIGGAAAGARNVIANNTGKGIAVVSGTSDTISRNSIFNNGSIGIDLANDGVTVNDLGDGDAGANGLLNFPILSTAAINGGNLVLTGFARPGSTIEVFISTPDPTGFGEGKTYITTLVEGSAADTDGTTGTYNNPVNGLNQGTDSTNKYRFSIPTPGGVGVATVLTATATDGSANTSEFSGNVAVTSSVNVSGIVYKDANHNGQIDSSETGTGLTLYAKIFLTSTPGGPATQAVVVDPTAGTYTFPTVTPGIYTIVIDDNNTLVDVTPTIPAGWSGTEYPTQTRSNVAVAATDVSNQNFGLIQALPLSGRAFVDTGAGGGTANDGVLNGGEAGLAGVVVKLTNNTGAITYDTVTTDGGGNYVLYVPETLAVGTPLKVVETNPATYISTGASVGNTLGTYTRATDTIAFSFVLNTTYTAVNFGEVPDIVFTSDNTQSALPGATVIYAHTFTAGSTGQVTFSTASAPAPAITGWSNTLYRDLNNNGQVDSTDTVITGPIALTAGQTIRILVKEAVPVAAPFNAQDTITVTANYSYTNANPALTTSATHTDITTVGNPTTAGLALAKSVDKATALPGDTLTYTVTYTNNASAALSSVIIYDSTPAFTTFLSASNGPLPNNLTAVAIIAPSVGATGALRWTFTGTLAPASRGTVTFQVKVDQ